MPRPGTTTHMRGRMATVTTDPPVLGRNLLRLMAWLSPAFPVGSFSYSHGLERAVHDGLVGNVGELEQWIAALLRHGSAWNDAVLLAESWRRAGNGGDLAEIADLAEALAGSKERQLESLSQGRAFLHAADSWPVEAAGRLPRDCTYCVAVGAVAGAHGISLEDTLVAFIQAFASNLIQAGIRLSVTGQQGAVAILARLEPLVTETASRAAGSTLDDLGGCTVVSDVAAMRHERQYSRLFRS